MSTGIAAKAFASLLRDQPVTDMHREVGTGTCWEIPSGHVGLVFARSSLTVEKSSNENVQVRPLRQAREAGFHGVGIAPIQGNLPNR